MHGQQVPCALLEGIDSAWRRVLESLPLSGGDLAKLLVQVPDPSVEKIASIVRAFSVAQPNALPQLWQRLLLRICILVGLVKKKNVFSIFFHFFCMFFFIFF